MICKSINMRRLFLGILLCCSLLSCVDETFLNDGSANGNGVKVAFSLVVPNAEEEVTEVAAASTRSTYENSIGNVFLLVFDENEMFLEIQPANEATGQYNYIASIAPQSRKCLIYVVANAPVIIDRVKDSWTPGITSLDDVKNSLLKDRLSGNDNNKSITQVPALPPLASVAPVEVPSISRAMTLADEIFLERATAKIVISVTAPGFSLYGANLCDAPVRGFVFGGLPLDAIGKADYWGPDGSGGYSPEYMLRLATAANPLYSYESPASNGTYLIVKAAYKGVDGYYRINLKDKNKQQLALQRNHQYTVNIQKVQLAGYRTAAEAKAGTALNDLPGNDVEVDVSDEYSHDIVSNGSEYLGVSHSELIIYQSGAINDLTAVTLNYTANGSWNDGSITVSGTGMTLSGSSVLPVTSVEANRNVKINLTANSTGGTLTFRIGNLYKVVKITRKNNLPSIPEEMVFEKIAVADKSGKMYKDKIAFSTQQGIYLDHNDKVNGEGKTMYVSIQPNAGFDPNYVTGSTTYWRSGEFYLAHSDDQGKIKVMYTQEYLDVYTGYVQIKPYTYVGTFHRWNETAERLIRIKAVEQDPNKKWTAIIVSGDEWIELDTNPSQDKGITMHPYGYNEASYPWSSGPMGPTSDVADGDNANYRTAAAVEANCQFLPSEKGKSVVNGTGKNVFFRIGLKSQLPGGQYGQPRYGLVALIHDGGNHLIYVRQGEEPDFLMRNGDSYGSGSSRPKVVKISPYNLTVPTAQDVAYFDVPQNGGVFVDYPSKGGYLFQGGNNYRGYRPYGAQSLNSTFRMGNNLCPFHNGKEGRVPQDGVSDTGNTGTFAGSELRQSFWLYPITGFGNSDYGNMIRGYIADGYFDRRRMRYPNYGSPLTVGATDRSNGNKDGAYATYQGIAVDESTNKAIKYPTPTVVDEIEGVDMAFAGMLLYNPYNFASIFIPAVGSRNGQVGNRLQGMGAESNLWTGTQVSGGYSYLATGYYNATGGAYKFVLDAWTAPNFNIEAFSIRTVWDK